MTLSSSARLGPYEIVAPLRRTRLRSSSEHPLEDRKPASKPNDASSQCCDESIRDLPRAWYTEDEFKNEFKRLLFDALGRYTTL